MPPPCSRKSRHVKKIIVDATGWLEPDDFYRAVLPVLGAPGWHGHNLDALWDSVTSNINDVQPPYTLTIKNSSQMSGEMVHFLSEVRSLFQQARDERGITVELRIEPGQ